MPHDVIWIWSKPRIEDLIDTYSDHPEGSEDAPMLYVAMSPQAALSFMRSMGASSIAAMVRMPGQERPTELPLNPYADVLPEKPPQFEITYRPPIKVDEPRLEAQIGHVLDRAQAAQMAREVGRCSQCGEPWEEWACGPTHAMVRNEMGIEYKPIDLGPMEITSEPVQPPQHIIHNELRYTPHG